MAGNEPFSGTFCIFQNLVLVLFDTFYVQLGAEWIEMAGDGPLDVE